MVLVCTKIAYSAINVRTCADLVVTVNCVILLLPMHIVKFQIKFYVITHPTIWLHSCHLTVLNLGF